MPSKTPETALRDILHHIELATLFTKGFDQADFVDDLRTVYAVTRCLEIISEASRRLPDPVKARHPFIPWKEMAAAGNVYRHDYEDVAARYVWNTLTRDLPRCASSSCRRSTALKVKCRL
jgi:uncharacterized protein with HEPN domain